MVMTLVGVVDEESLGSFATNKPEVDVGLLVKNHVVVKKVINMKKKSLLFFLQRLWRLLLVGGLKGRKNVFDRDLCKELLTFIG